jgi:acyl carrier protein
MHFGENVREIVSISCGQDLRSAKSRTALPGIDSPEVQKRLAANLERQFDITLSEEDVSHLTTVRAVLQCVRLRRWERDMERQESVAAALAAQAADEAVAPSMRDRFVRYTPPAAPPAHVPTAPSFALRKS